MLRPNLFYFYNYRWWEVKFQFNMFSVIGGKQEALLERKSFKGHLAFLLVSYSGTVTSRGLIKIRFMLMLTKITHVIIRFVNIN